jgi:hypothetical protein
MPIPRLWRRRLFEWWMRALADGPIACTSTPRRTVRKSFTGSAAESVLSIGLADTLKLLLGRVRFMVRRQLVPLASILGPFDFR